KSAGADSPAPARAGPAEAAAGGVSYSGARYHSGGNAGAYSPAAARDGPGGSAGTANHPGAAQAYAAPGHTRCHSVAHHDREHHAGAPQGKPGYVDRDRPGVLGGYQWCAYQCGRGARRGKYALSAVYNGRRLKEKASTVPAWVAVQPDQFFISSMAWSILSAASSAASSMSSAACSA